jgi:hypothetical protein
MPEVTIRDLRTTNPLPAELLLRTEADLSRYTAKVEQIMDAALAEVTGQRGSD